MDLENTYTAKDFGKAQFFVLMDTTSMNSRLIANTKYHFGGKDHPVEIATKNEANAILASNLGHFPSNKLKNNNYTI